jgi:hypothetical protein
MYLSIDSIFKGQLYIRSVLESGYTTDRQVDVTGILKSRLMPAFHKFYGRYNDLIQNYKLSLNHLVSDIFHTNG